MADQCGHQQRNPEGVEWSDNDSLGHFLECLSRLQQAEAWVRLRRMADGGHVCLMADHRGRIEQAVSQLVQQQQAIRVQDEYIGQQTAKLRELEAYCKAESGVPLNQEYVAGQVSAILGLVVSDEEPL